MNIDHTDLHNRQWRTWAKIRNNSDAVRDLHDMHILGHVDVYVTDITDEQIIAANEADMIKYVYPYAKVIKMSHNGVTVVHNHVLSASKERLIPFDKISNVMIGNQQLFTNFTIPKTA